MTDLKFLLNWKFLSENELAQAASIMVFTVWSAANLAHLSLDLLTNLGCLAENYQLFTVSYLQQRLTPSQKNKSVTSNLLIDHFASKYS